MPTPQLRRYTLTLTGHKPTPASYNPLSYFRAAPDNDGFRVQFHTGTATDTANPENTMKRITKLLHSAAHLKPINKVRFEEGEPVVSIDKTATQTQKSDVLNTAISALNTHLRERDTLSERYNIPLVQPIYYSDSEFETFLETLADQHPNESIFIDIIDKRTDPTLTADTEEQPESHLYYYSSVDGVTLTTDSAEDLIKTMTDNLYWQSLSIDEQDAIVEAKGEASTARTKAQAKACLSLTAALGLASVGAYFLGPLCLTATTAAPIAGAAVGGGDVTPAAGGHYAATRGIDSVVTMTLNNYAVNATIGEEYVLKANDPTTEFGVYVDTELDLNGDGNADLVASASAAGANNEGETLVMLGNPSLSDRTIPPTPLHTSIVGASTDDRHYPLGKAHANNATRDDLALTNGQGSVWIVKGGADFVTNGPYDLSSLAGAGFELTGPLGFGNGYTSTVIDGIIYTAIAAPISNQLFVIGGPLENINPDLTVAQANVQVIQHSGAINQDFGVALGVTKQGANIIVQASSPKTNGAQSRSGVIWNIPLSANPGDWTTTAIPTTDPSIKQIYSDDYFAYTGGYSFGNGPVDPWTPSLAFYRPFPNLLDQGSIHLSYFNFSTLSTTNLYSTLPNLVTWNGSLSGGSSLFVMENFLINGEDAQVITTFGNPSTVDIGTVLPGHVHLIPTSQLISGYTLTDTATEGRGGLVLKGTGIEQRGATLSSTQEPLINPNPSITTGSNDGTVRITTAQTVDATFTATSTAIDEDSGTQTINLGVSNITTRSGNAVAEIITDPTIDGILAVNPSTGVTITPIFDGFRLEGVAADVTNALNTAVTYQPNLNTNGPETLTLSVTDQSNTYDTDTLDFTINVTPTVDTPILFPAALSAAFPNDTFEQNQFRSHTVLIDDLVDDPDGVFNADNFDYNITTPAGLNGYRDTDRLRVEGSAQVGGQQMLLFDICRTSPPGYCAQTNVTTYITPVSTDAPAPNTTTTTTTRSPNGPNPNGSEEENNGNFLAVISASGVGGVLVLWSAITCIIRCCTAPKRESLKDENETASNAKAGQVASVCGPLVAAALTDIVTNAYLEEGSAYETSIIILLQALHERKWNVYRIMRILISLVEDDDVLLEILRRPGFKESFVKIAGTSLLTQAEFKTLGANQQASYDDAITLLNQKSPEALLVNLRADIPALFDDTSRQRSPGELRLNIAKAAEKGSYETWSATSIATAGRCCGTCTSKPSHAKMNRFTAQVANRLDKAFNSYKKLEGRHKVNNTAHLFASAPGATTAFDTDGIELNAVNPLFGDDTYGSVGSDVGSSGGFTDATDTSTGSQAAVPGSP